MSKGAPEGGALDPNLLRFITSLAIADARRDHFIAIGKLKPEEHKPKRSSTKEPEGRVTLRFIVDDQE